MYIFMSFQIFDISNAFIWLNNYKYREKSVCRNTRVCAVSALSLNALKNAENS